MLGKNATIACPIGLVYKYWRLGHFQSSSLISDRYFLRSKTYLFSVERILAVHQC